MANNFKDPETGEEFFIARHSIVPRPSGTVYLAPNKKELSNPANGNILVPIPKDPSECGIPFLGKSNNKEELSKMLKARSHEHYNREIADVRYQKNKDLVDKYKNT